MAKLKPPAPTSVSATLRAAGFAAYRDGLDGRDEGYLAEWTQNAGSAVRVSFESADKDMRALALEKMADVLTRKGWSVTANSRGQLIVEER